MKADGRTRNTVTKAHYFIYVQCVQARFVVLVMRLKELRDIILCPTHAIIIALCVQTYEQVFGVVYTETNDNVRTQSILMNIGELNASTEVVFAYYSHFLLHNNALRNV